MMRRLLICVVASLLFVALSGCESTGKSKGCGPDCTKPCCAKTQCPPDCTKPCCAKK